MGPGLPGPISRFALSPAALRRCSPPRCGRRRSVRHATLCRAERGFPARKRRVSGHAHLAQPRCSRGRIRRGVRRWCGPGVVSNRCPLGHGLQAAREQAPPASTAAGWATSPSDGTPSDRGAWTADGAPSRLGGGRTGFRLPPLVDGPSRGETAPASSGPKAAPRIEAQCARTRFSHLGTGLRYAPVFVLTGGWEARAVRDPRGAAGAGSQPGGRPPRGRPARLPAGAFT